jgi:hypothetical protein
MKVIIKESQLDNIIDKYITSQLGNLTKKLEKVQSSVNRWVFKNKEGDVMMVLVIGMSNIPEVSINNDIYKNIVNLFGLKNEFIKNERSKKPKVQNYLINWVRYHMYLEVSSISTFENGNEEFIY